ncbi:MAG: histidine kinase N-terminal 7TM domain-containing protein [Myxococcota bacterium]
MHPQLFEASITTLLATSLATYSLANGQPGRSRQIFLWLVAAVMIWSGGVALSHGASDVRGLNFFVRVAFIGIFALPPAWYALAFHLTRRADHDLTLRGLALLTLPSVVFCLLMLTNRWHHLYMREPDLIGTEGPPVWAGPAFWLWVAWSYLLICGGSARYVSWSWRLVNEDARWRGALIALASILPLGGNAAHLLGLTAGDHDRTPLLLGFATLALFFADWRFRMLDTLPVARRDVIDQIRDGVIVADTRGVILDLNAAAREVLGSPASELIGQPLIEVVGRHSAGRVEYDAEQFEAAVAAMCRSASGFETAIQDADGRHYEVRGSTVVDRVGAISGIYLIVRDVTEQRRHDEVRRESRRARSIASLAAGFAHEVNNPLSYVRGNVGHAIAVLDEWRDLLAGKGDEVDDLQSALDEAIEGIDRIGTIVERVRQFTRTEGSIPESIEIAPIIDEALRLSAGSGDLAIAVERDLESGLPPVSGVRDGLVEAVVHVLDNARHALQETGGKIRVRARRVAHTIRIEVEDDGPGVGEDVRDEIFEPFFSVGAHAFGAGLGLAIARKCVAEIGGTIAHEPVASGGARFVIELPHG